jgi:hypothetical protein
MNRCLRIEAPYFCAGVLVDENGNVVSAPPILRYMRNWPVEGVIAYCRKKHWKTQYVDRSTDDEHN